MELPDMSELSDEDLDALISMAMSEYRLRRLIAEAPELALREQEESERRLEAIASGWHAAQGGIGSPQVPREWFQPTGPHNTWPKNSYVVHNDKVWRSVVPNNSHVPGTDHGQAWVHVTADPPAGEFIPWGAGQEVKVDDLRTHSGKLWRAKLDHTTHVGWEPSAFTHTVWEDMGPVPEKKPQ